MQSTSEPRPSRWARLRARLAGRGHHVFSVAAFLTVLVSTATIWPDAVQTGDSLFHVGNAVDVERAVRLGQDPLGRLPQMQGTPTFRFYQPLHALATGAMTAWTPVRLEFWYTLFTVLPFALSPFAYMYLLTGLGFSRWRAALGAFVSITTVLGFSNSFLGLFSGGIVTQAPAALFFPLFLGKFVRVLRGERGVLGAAAFFALTVLSHAAFAVYAVVAAFLATAILLPKGIRPLAKCAAAGALGVLLAAFWVLPFLAVQAEHRPIPDAVSRPDRRIWFSGISGRELFDLVRTGRFFDGERDVDRDKGSDEPLDSKMRALNIFGLHTLRPPIFSICLAIGVLFALVRIRDPSVRFLLGLMTTGFLLVLGLDDVRIVARLPFTGQMQGFRATYLVDQGALGLVALGLHEVGSLFLAAARRLPRIPRRIAGGLGVFVAVGALLATSAWLFVHARAIVGTGRGPWEFTFLESMGRYRQRMGPYRVRGHYKAGTNQNRRNNHIHVLGFAVPCAHVSGITGQTARTVCERIGTPGRSWRLAELVGTSYFLVDRRYPHGLDAVEKVGDRGRYRRLSNRRNMQLWESRMRTFGHMATGPIVLVHGTHAQWVQLNEEWLGRWSNRLEDPRTPWPVRVQPGDLERGPLLRQAASVLIVDTRPFERAPAGLQARAEQGLPVHVLSPIPGLRAKVLGPADGWERAFSGLPRAAARPEDESFRLLPSPSPGREFRLQTVVKRAGIAMVAEGCFANWHAWVDGKPADVRPAGPDLVGVYLPAGTRRLVIRWQRTTLENVSYAASLLGWMGVFSWIAIDRRRRRRARPGGEGAPVLPVVDPAAPP